MSFELLGTKLHKIFHFKSRRLPFLFPIAGFQVQPLRVKVPIISISVNNGLGERLK